MFRIRSAHVDSAVHQNSAINRMTLSTNRIRHIVRRLREAPTSFLFFRLALLFRKIAWWPRVVLARRIGHRQVKGPAVSGTFEAMGDDLRAEVSRCGADDPEYVSALRERVGWLLNERRLPCLGYGFVPLPRGAEWRSDVTTGYTWPDRYFPFVNFITHGADADVKVPWEISRLQWLVWLAESLVVETPSGGKRALEAIEATLMDWSASNPVGYGPNWTVSMEVGIRAINIGLAASLAWPRLGTSTRFLLSRLLREHLHYLRAFPEKSDHAGNHYLLNVASIVFLEGVVFGDREGVALTVRDWWDDVAVQFESDGLHVEHAPLYHRLCVEALSWTIAFAKRAGMPIHEDAPEVLESSCSALARLEMTCDALPVLGDSDSGQVISFGQATRSLLYLRQLLGMAAGAPALLRAAAGTDDVLQGAEVLRSLDALNGVVNVGPWVRARRGQFDIVVRGGAHGLFGRATHDHDDNGSPWVVFGFRDLLAEVGCFSYTRSFVERAADIASASHNLVTLGNRLRFVPAPGSISPSVAHAPIARRESSVTHEHIMLSFALHWDDALAGHVRHDRFITLADAPSECMIVDDTLRLSRSSDVVVHWYFAPEWRLSFQGPDSILAETADHAVALLYTMSPQSLSAPVLLSIRSYRHSPRYGEAVTASAIEARASGETVRLISTFRSTASS